MSFIETVGIVAQLVQSYLMGIFSTFGLTLLSAFFLYGTNMFFCLIFIKQVTQDLAFKHWVKQHKFTYKTVLTLGGLMNFKLFRVIYGQFFGRDNFNAAFDDA